MTSHAPFQALLDDLQLDIDQLCRLTGVDARWVQQRVADGLLAGRITAEAGSYRFDAVALRRVRRMVCLERDFDAVPELAALVADLEDEIRELRARIGRSAAPNTGS